MHNSADTAWLALVNHVMNYGIKVSPRGIACSEVLQHTSTVDMARCVTTVRPKLGYRFLAAEAWWILSGRNDVDSITTYSPHIKTFSNDGMRFDGAYGPRIIDQLRYVCDKLESDLETRQAVLEIWRPNPRDSKDIPCTLTVQWVIRWNEVKQEYELHCFDNMRSSDVWLGWPYDVFNFSMLSAYVALILRARAIKSLATKSLARLQLGGLWLTAGSQHLYLHPKVDGQNNVPYSIEDASMVCLQRPEPIYYQPLNLSEFATPQHLVDFLGRCKDRDVYEHDPAWLAEFTGRRIGVAL